MTIAPQCRPGSYNHAGHSPVCDWPEDCYVQWGGQGVVLAKKESGGCYYTAFFEAFPKNPKTFIRGEGATVAEAEQSAFQKFKRYLACPGHEFERRGYTNGAGFCKHCSLFKSNAFEPIPPTPEEQARQDAYIAKMKAEDEEQSPITKEEMREALSNMIQALARNIR